MTESGKKKAILITGCDSGFGFSLASHLSEARAEDVVTIAACFYPNGNKEGADCLAGLKSVHVIQLDVTSDDSIQEAVVSVDEILEKTDTVLWAVVNNAATLVFADAMWHTRALVRRQIDVNFIGCWAVSQAFMPHLMTSKGRIVNMMSFCTECPLPTLSVYTATKAALLSLSNGMRMELAKHGVDVILFNPGDHPTETPLCSGQDGNYATMAGSVSDRFKDHPDVMRQFGECRKKFTQLFPQPCLKKLDNPGLYVEFDKIIADPKPGHSYVNSDWITRAYFGILKVIPTTWSDWARTALMRLPK